MTTILDKIIKEKHKEVVKLKKQPFNYTDSPYTGPTFAELVQKNTNMSMIAEIKHASPSEGFINGDVDHAKAAGANIILLIAAALDDDTMKSLYDYAVANNLEVICEVHHESEMENVLELNPRLIGVNNRDLKTFNVDLTTTARVAESA